MTQNLTLTPGVKSDLLQGCDWIDAHNKRMVKHGTLEIPDEGSRLRISKHMRVVTEAARQVPELRARITELEKELGRVEVRDAKMLAGTNALLKKLGDEDPQMKGIITTAITRVVGDQPGTNIHIGSLAQADAIIGGTP